MGARRVQFVVGPRYSTRPTSQAADVLLPAADGTEQGALSEQPGGVDGDEREGTLSEKEQGKGVGRILHYSAYTRDHVQMLGEWEP